jgi:signal transduction histidine kinase
LAIPTYTTAPPDAGLTPTAGPGVSVRPARFLSRALARSWARSRLVQLGLDLAMVAVTLMTFGHVAPPEVLFHVIFIVLIGHAFLFGLRGTLWRIALVSVVIVGYSIEARAVADLDEMDLAEWPLMLVIAVLVALMADRREAAARHYATLFGRASARLLAVQEDERRRFARELHDGLGQTITALTLTLDAAIDGTTKDERLASARRLASDALLETHDLATRLRPARIDQLGLAGALKDLSRTAGCPVRLVIDPAASAVGILTPGAAVEVYRMAQEALANVVRHSGAELAEMSLTMRNERTLRLLISDSGRGFEPSATRDSGLGLAGMRERAVLLAATLTIMSAPGAGTTITVDVPIGAVSPELR